MRKKTPLTEELLSVRTPKDFEKFLMGHHDAYVAVRFGLSDRPRCSHSDAVKRLDRLMEVWQATTALTFPHAEMGLHHRRVFRSVQAYVEGLASLLEERKYERLGREIDSALRTREVEFKKQSVRGSWVNRVRYPIGLLHGDAIVIQCLLELSSGLKTCTPRISLAMTRDKRARWIRTMREEAGVSPWRLPPAPRSGAKDPEQLKTALALLEQGKTPKHVSRRVGVSLATVYRWRKRYGLARQA